MKKGGESLVTSNIAKSKTAAQLITIIFTLIYLSINNSTVPILDNLSGQIDQFNLVYNLTFIVSLFTVFTGYMYVKDNFTEIKKIIFK